MTRKNILGLALLFLLTGQTAMAQFEIQYPNLLMNDYFYNPATAGSKDHNPMRATVRRQWMGIEHAPAQHTVSFDGLLFQYRVGMGIGLMNQSAGPASLNSINYSWSYRVPYSLNSMFAFGVSGMLAQYVIDYRLLDFDDPNDQLIQKGFRRSYLPDANAGLYLYSTKYNLHKYFLGVSVLNMLDTEKKLPWFDNQVEAHTQKRTFCAMAGNRFRLGGKLAFEPSVIAMLDDPEAPENTVVDINGKITWNDSLWVGASYRPEESRLLPELHGRFNEHPVFV